MRQSMSVPLMALFLFCVVQLLALYLWLPHRIIAEASAKRSQADKSQDGDPSPEAMKGDLRSSNPLGDLPARFTLLAHDGRGRGLSDAQMMGLLLHALHPVGEGGNRTESHRSPRRKTRDGSASGIDSKQERGTKDETSSGIAPKQEDRNQQLTDDSVVVKVNVGVTPLRSRRVTANDGYQYSGAYPWNNITDPINPHDYKLVINQPDLCRTNGSETFLLVLMISTPGGAKQRQMQRDSCLSVKNVTGRIIRSVFLLGNSGKDDVTAKVRSEAAEYGDIIMEDFEESYRNLTLKTLMGIKWASVYCPQAQYVIKTDDDVFLHLTNIVGLLEKSPRERFMTGYVYKGTKPLRDKRYKWYISEETYPRNDYPPYCCGVGYILSQDLLPGIYTESLSIPYIFLEDVYVGLCIEKLNVVPKVNPGFFSFRQDYEYCKFKKAYVVHTKKIHQIGQFWINQQKRPINATC